MFGGVGIAFLFVLLVVVPRLSRGESGVAALPTVARELPPVVPAPPVAAMPHVFAYPTLSKTQIAFSFGGEIWTVPREGGTARRLVTGQLSNNRPIFSPDGTQIAYTGVYDGNVDVYVIAATGGEPHRLTFHPAFDVPLAWSPDGKSIVFGSNRTTERDLPQLWTVPATGGPAERLPLPAGNAAAYSPDAKRLAYQPFPLWQPAWKHYRGGQAAQIWIADLATSHVTKVPRETSNDLWPMWSDNTIYFVSDRAGPKALFAYDLGANKVSELARDAHGFDITSASIGPGGIVFDRLGQIAVYDFAAKQIKPVPITISDELPQTRARFMPVGPEQILRAAISPTGKRVLIEAHGEVLSVPVDKGNARNLTTTPGIADRSPAWSPDGKWIAWLSDRSGEYELYFMSPDGLGALHIVELHGGGYYYTPRWSPDSKNVVIPDKNNALWLVDLDHPTPVQIDRSRLEEPISEANAPVWSPDSQWITYTKPMPNLLHAVFVYSLADKTAHQLTDARSDARAPRFDRSGKYLWFLASTNLGPAEATSDMSGLGRATTGSLYGIVLRKDLPSPFAPESDEEAAGSGAGSAAAKGEPAKTTRIDLDAIDQRIIAAPIPRANYLELEVGDNALFVLSTVVAESDEDLIEVGQHAPAQVQKLDLKTRKLDKFIDKLDQPDFSTSDSATFELSADGSKALYTTAGAWFVVDTAKPAGAGDGALKLDDLQVWVDPRAEWKQMFHEVWRIERDFLYDPKAHGLDLAQAERVYAPFVDGIGGREGLNALFVEMLGNLVLGHVFVGGGALPPQGNEADGLLGANLAIEGDHYKIAKILKGENWNPQLVSPLTQPGVIVKEGDVILAVNGVAVSAAVPFDKYMLGTANKRTLLTLASNGDGKDKREVTVVPIPNEGQLRLREWMDGNRRRVDQLSNGKLAYVYIPDTDVAGFLNFNRYYYSQTDKQGVVVDERFNHGGLIADYVIRALQASVAMGISSRTGDDLLDPAATIYGPRVMIANEMSGSGGDALPWLFKRAKLGPLVGTRTWGGLVGISDYPRLIDGGGVTAPRAGLFSAEGKWEIENIGVSPDVEVEQDPELIRAGHDPQLEKAVQLALDELAKHPFVRPKRPAFPDYGPRLPRP
jgi:tricorn protease